MERMNAAPAITLDYPIVQRTLDNSLRVISSPDHVSPSVAVNLWYHVGSRDEEAGRTGFAHLFEHIMFQGSANVASGQHIALMQAAGASVNATTWFDRTNYFETLPTGGLDLALWLEADRLGTLLDALTQESLDNQREVVKEERRQRYDNVPYGDATELLTALTFPPDHPYGHTTIGSMEDLDAATLADVQSFFRTHYLPNNAVLSIVGDVAADGAFERAETYFGHLPSGTKPGKPDGLPLPPLTGQERGEVSGLVPAEAVYLSWRLPARGTRDFDALDLAFTVLGHGQTSRLHKAMVRGTERAEAAGANALGMIGGNSSGLVYARARDGVPVEQLEADLLTEVDRLQSAPPTEMELRRAKAQYQRHWLHELVRLDSRADAFGEYATLHGDPNLVNTRIAEINAVNLDDIADVLPRWFGVDQRATLIYRREAR
jgi:zinc protease